MAARISGAGPGQAPTYVSQQQLAENLDSEDIQIIDVRDDDFDGGHIPGCRNIPSAVFQQHMGYLAQEFAESGKVLIFHCMFSQSRGPTCARRFSRYLDENYPQRSCKVAILEGGFGAWEETFERHPDAKKYIEDKPEERQEGPKMFYVMQ
eukprot:TRINITY_DN112855_c0_g1_i1.p1 TRINITY_DN112855_c0_g1~~TRINITY_DN112855_c0_g1_i1.p1  ORF type:complete len:151 (-),score=30.42 TRINITY_DN112855_c0_g1_i1:343-795(-)